MRLFIPTIGQILQLEKDWTVKLQKESRNDDMIKKHGEEITFPAGTRFAVDRLYVRKGLPKYDSVTFRILTEPKGRFWVNLPSANEIEFNIAESEMKVHKFLRGADVLTEAKTVAVLLSNIKGRYYNRTLGEYVPTFMQIFHEEVLPLMTNWNIRNDYKGEELSSLDLSTDVKTKSKVPMYEPKDLSKYPPSKWIEENNKKAGKTEVTRYGVQKHPDTYHQFDPYEAMTAFKREFTNTLKKLKGVKKEEEILKLLPSPYSYEVHNA